MASNAARKCFKDKAFSSA